MQDFQIIDEKREPLNVWNETNLPYYRWEKRAILGWNFRTFLVFVDNYGNGTGPKNYIEEITAGSLQCIKDNSLWKALSNFAHQHELLNILTPLSKK